MSDGNNDTRQLLVNGLSDAVGFVGGALLGFWLGKLLGLDIFAPGYGTGSLIGIAMVGIGGGLGLHVARRWQTSRRSQPSKD
ncbi:hypothetical protein OIN59_11860 [Acidovorax sp. D2M1]|uniref:AtpZ/AtpI family protein n=1 Tax=Acidovorax benzenivorans TaxID=2987520 RepID=A0ABT5RWP7_9BURK|nr:hypothetical protein [Acidovorax benzenivorans]MDD2178130.1 hypothetical protein [Acidovorax benzenivorans]